MKKLSIKLNQKYRSFESGFAGEFEGDLIIFSGVNGSGKSQLISIISQRDDHNKKQSIAATIILDQVPVIRDEIIRRSFKDNVSVPELTHAGTETIANHKNNAWNAYYNYLLNHNDQNLWDYNKSCKRAKNILIEKYGEQKFNNKQIVQTELKDALPSDFVWKSDDIFANFIGELFFNYALDVYDAQAKAGREGTAFNADILLTPPWKQLNDLFTELGFEYRFKENYFVQSLQINEQPCLSPIKNDKTINENEPRKLADLSDGEKAILSLSFASLSGVKHEDKKVLLLDEFDANFNPSLTEIFYKILNQYFISKGILVIIATHSPTTISLAPDSASFYEVFKANAVSSDRVLPVQKDDYAELEIANRSFYTKVSNQTERIAELEHQKNMIEKEINNLKAQVKPRIYVEGEIDEIYFNKALEVFDKKPSYPADVKCIGYKDESGNYQFTGKDNMEKAEKFLIAQPLPYKTILFYDVDCKKPIKTEGNLTIYCPAEVNGSKYKTGVEHLLIIPENFNISDPAFQEEKQNGDKRIFSPNKEAIKDYVMGLQVEQQKQWLEKIKEILESFEADLRS